MSSSSYNNYLGFWWYTNFVPSDPTLVLNSTLGTNLTTENLTVYITGSTDPDGDSLTNITDWRKDGASIAVLNMPFDTDVSSTSSGAVRDYSTFGNNGTLGTGNSSKAPTWNSSGKVGGAYDFDGVDDYIDAGNDSSLDIEIVGTVAAWIRADSLKDAGVVTRASGSSWDDGRLTLLIRSNGNVGFSINNGSAGLSSSLLNSGASTITNNTWYHIVGTFNGSTASLYVDSVSKDSKDYAFIPEMSGYDLLIGWWNGLGYFNGTIDEVQIYNHSLSAEQISALYQAGLANHSIETIVSQETAKGETWEVAVTPNDGTSDGNTVVSNNLTILNSLPVVTLSSPPDNNVTTNRTPEFTWNVGTDADGDSLTYEVNISLVASSLCTDPDRNPSGISGLSYVTDPYLKCLIDNGDYYNWTVRANDGEGSGDWATSRRIDIQATIIISLPNNTVDFGSLSQNENKNTTNDNPPPFLLQNDGNAILNISLNATDLWTSITGSSIYFEYKIDNKSGEEGSFNWQQSTTNFDQMPNTTQIAIVGFNWSDSTDSAEIDLNITVPPDEVGGDKESTVYFTGSLGE